MKNIRPVSDEWLREKYITEGLDCVQIAAIVSRDPKTVWSWLRSIGVRTRPRGDASRLNKGRPHGYRHSEATKAALRSARVADRHYPKQADGSPYWSGKTGQDHPAWKGGSTPERQAFYASREWKLACRETWERADAKCERCGLDHRQVNRNVKKFHVHHIMPFIFPAYRASASNLALLCEECHRFVHSDTNLDREFLPPFGVFPDQASRLIPISYRPKCNARLAWWLK
jgi:hypothetical protein